jgi:type III pantothenate kinase
MNICIDFGNTSIKAAIFNEDKMVKNLPKLSQVELLNLVNNHKEYKLAIASVNQEVTHIVNLIENKQRLTMLNSSTPLPIQNQYESPQTLGMDRLAAAVGANFLYPNQNCLVIDAGTCITYDLIDKNGNYQGGSISPGLNMRFKALNHFTSKLPLIKEQTFEGLTGKNTQDSIISGVSLGLTGEINWIIDEYKAQFLELTIIICGGDASFFESRIKHHIFAVPELVLIGLNRALNYNAK